MRLHTATSIGLALGWALSGCGDGHHVDGFESADPLGDDLGDDTLRLERSWSEGLLVQVEALAWVEPGELSVRLTVVDPADGKAIRGLDEQHFSFEEDGEALGEEVLFEVRPVGNLEVVLVLDLSRSMQRAKAVEPLREAASALIEALPLGATVSLVRFSTEHQPATPFSDDPHALERHVDDLLPLAGREGQFTNLWGSLVYAASLFEGPAPDPAAGLTTTRVAVVFTDGRDNVAEAEAGEAMAALAEKGVEIYAIGLGDEVDRAALRRLAGSDHYTETSEPRRLSRLFADVGESLGEALQIRYVTPKQSGQHTLSVTIGASAARGGFDLIFEPTP